MPTFGPGTGPGTGGSTVDPEPAVPVPTRGLSKRLLQLLLPGLQPQPKILLNRAPFYTPCLRSKGIYVFLLGGALSFNLVFPSNEPDIWRLMGMWSIWMFTIPSLRARDCSKNEKEALNYLFLLVPLLNVLIPFFVRSFAVVWSAADTIAFFGMYAWKLGWLSQKK